MARRSDVDFTDSIAAAGRLLDAECPHYGGSQACCSRCLATALRQYGATREQRRVEPGEGGFHKRTVLDRAKATGDYECFCFEASHEDPKAHRDEQERLGHEIEMQCRTYPDALLPGGHDGRFGRWVIDVTFEPEVAREERE